MFDTFQEAETLGGRDELRKIRRKLKSPPAEASFQRFEEPESGIFQSVKMRKLMRQTEKMSVAEIFQVPKQSKSNCFTFGSQED